MSIKVILKFCSNQVLNIYYAEFASFLKLSCKYYIREAMRVDSPQTQTVVVLHDYNLHKYVFTQIVFEPLRKPRRVLHQMHYAANVQD